MTTEDRSPARIGIAERTDSKGRTQYRGTAYDKLAKRHLRGHWTPHLAEARAWRVDALARLQSGTLSADLGPTTREGIARFLEGIEAGTIRDRSGHPYKPSTRRGYERNLRGRVLPAFGATRLARLTRQDVQLWVDSLDGAPSTVRNAVTALRALYAWAIPRGLAQVNPTRDLRLPSGERERDRIASPTEAAALVEALQPRDQALFGLAVYAGLRLGEILALRWESINLEGLTLRVERSWDASSRQFVKPKSKAGTRTVPIIDRLALLLADHRVLTNHPTGGLLFVSDRVADQPVHPTPLRRRLHTAWRKAKLEPLGLHEARHTFASMMIAAGVNAKALSSYLGHANIAITFDRYGHLMPGSEAEARDRLNAYLDR
ncbi:MAG: tyrosine-type recombinase/integrase [Actinomycetota bacterium]